MKRLLRFPTPTRILEATMAPLKSALPVKPITGQSLGQDVIKRRTLETIVRLHLRNLKRVYRGGERQKRENVI